MNIVLENSIPASVGNFLEMNLSGPRTAANKCILCACDSGQDHRALSVLQNPKVS